MTSPRRLARGAGPLDVATLAGMPVPPELLDGDDPLWHDQDAYRGHMARRGWTLPVAERLGATTHPANRRRAAAVGWASSHQLATSKVTGLDGKLALRWNWRQLRSWGLID